MSCGGCHTLVLAKRRPPGEDAHHLGDSDVEEENGAKVEMRNGLVGASVDATDENTATARRKRRELKSLQLVCSCSVFSIQ